MSTIWQWFSQAFATLDIDSMNVFILGSGGREHALAWKSAQDDDSKVFVAPGNGGTLLEDHITNLNVDINDFDAVATACKDHAIDLVIVGPEVPLVNGIVDYLAAKDILAFGPTAKAARLEGSKVFAKEFFKKYAIPTAGYQSFTNFEEASDYAKSVNYPIVIKADGLAAGKGVVICNSKEEALETLNEMLNNAAFGDAGNQVILEEFLKGEEASFIAVVAGNKILPLATSQDHKTIFENDTGPNTGGMGAYSPAPIVTESIHKQVMSEVMQRAADGLIQESSPFYGFLYAGLMIDGDKIKVLEFNCRFGDPETQPILMRLETSLNKICMAALQDKLDTINIEWKKESAVGVVISAPGYPGNYPTGSKITLPATENSNTKIFHAGTKLDQSSLVTNGGRVLCVTALGRDLADAQKSVYQTIQSIEFDGMYFRKDIGNKAL